MKIKFLKDLPPAGTSTGRPTPPELLAFADALRAQPGKWATYPRPLTSASSASVTAASINTGRAAAFRGGFEAAVRQKQLYVRYAG